MFHSWDWRFQTPKSHAVSFLRHLTLKETFGLTRYQIVNPQHFCQGTDWKWMLHAAFEIRKKEEEYIWMLMNTYEKKRQNSWVRDYKALQQDDISDENRGKKELHKLSAQYCDVFTQWQDVSKTLQCITVCHGAVTQVLFLAERTLSCCSLGRSTVTYPLQCYDPLWI